MRLAVSDRSNTRWAEGDRILVELNGRPVETSVVALHWGVGTRFLLIDVDVPVGTPVRIGRHRKVA